MADNGSIFTIRLSASRIFTRRVSKITIGYIRSSGRCCHSRPSSSAASLAIVFGPKADNGSPRLITSGETRSP
jgi:hypothetical protein